MKFFLLSLREIFTVLFIQYFIIIIYSIIFGTENNYIIINVLLCTFDIIFIIHNYKINKFSFSFEYNYLLYIMLGISISVIYNMILYGFNLYTYDTNNTNFIFNVLISGIIGPVFEEILFRVNFIPKIEKFIYNKYIVILIASLIFSILHFSITSSIIALIVGIVNSYIYIKTRDIIRISLLHVSVNIMSIFITNYNLIILVLGIVLMIISILSFLIKKE